MPVYGLPSALESSLNSLAGVRPPTSWRVSGHGDDITVVLRWSECSSPSSDRTIHYDIDHNPKDRLQESDWRQFQSTTLVGAQDVYPRSVGSVLSTTSAKMETDALRMRYSTTLPRRRHRMSPVPMIISSSTSMSQKAPQNPKPPSSAVVACADAVDRSRSVVSADSPSSLGSVDGGSRCSSGCESVGNHSSSSVADGSPEGSRHESEIRNGIRAYLNQEIEIDKAEERGETASPGNFRCVSRNSTSSNYDSQRSKTQTDENTQRSSGSCSPHIMSEHSGSHLLICQPNRNESPKNSSNEQPIKSVNSKVADEGQNTRAFESVSCNHEACPEPTGLSADKTVVHGTANDDAAEEDLPSFDLDMACSAELGQGDKDDEAEYPEHYYWDRYDPLNDTEDLINVEIQADSPPDSISDEM